MGVLLRECEHYFPEGFVFGVECDAGGKATGEDLLRGNKGVARAGGRECRAVGGVS